MLCAHAAVPASITAAALATAMNLECIATSVDRRSIVPTQRVRRRLCSVAKAARALPWRRKSSPRRAARRELRRRGKDDGARATGGAGRRDRRVFDDPASPPPRSRSIRRPMIRCRWRGSRILGGERRLESLLLFIRSKHPDVKNSATNSVNFAIPVDGKKVLAAGNDAAFDLDPRNAFAGRASRWERVTPVDVFGAAASS